MNLILLFSLLTVTIAARQHSHGGNHQGKRGTLSGKRDSPHGRRGSLGDRRGSLPGRRGSLPGKRGSLPGKRGSSPRGRRQFNPKHDDHWKKYKKSFRRRFRDNDDEDFRRDVWERNFDRMKKHNDKFHKGHRRFRTGLNQFADYTHEEFMKLNGFVAPNISTIPTLVKSGVTESVETPDDTTAIDAIDWRDGGAITPVKNQESCGACWSFAACGALEAHLAIQTGNLISLSPQNLIDCSTSYGNNGCSGGAMMYAYQYVADNGIDSYDSYPYLNMESGNCSHSRDNYTAISESLVNLPTGDEEALRKAVAKVGPVTVAIDATLDSFQFYQEGIYDDDECSNTTMNHGVLVVGYGTENGTDYWILKNSWGTSWGEEGFFKMARNNNNQCGIANQASYPIM